jgi:hypothetical protein
MEKIVYVNQSVTLLACDKMTNSRAQVIFPLAFAIRPAKMRHLPSGAFNAQKKA